MPEICRFMGIVVRMYYREHNPPHVHVSYAGQTAVFRIQDLAVIAGGLPPRTTGLVAEWILTRQRELLDDWHRAGNGEPLVPIKPL